jgi:hypothetical protein
MLQSGVVVDVHLEELGQHSWVKALFNTLIGSNGSALYRFVARGRDDGHSKGDHAAVGATFPMMRWSDLDDLTEPNAWLDTARERLQELDAQLLADGWQRRPGNRKHWWSMSYQRA